MDNLNNKTISNSEDDYCLVCCDTFDNNKVTLKCNHSFHIDCLKLSLKCAIKNKKNVHIA